MNTHQFSEIVSHPEYDFLRTNENLGESIILLGLGGSHAYGTNNENSDVDIRGIATNSKRNILTGNDFEQVVDEETDTTIYSFDKIIKLLCACNPNTIEILGLKPEHYLLISPLGRAILDNKSLFLSQVAIHSFGGYANSQLRRLENKSARLVGQEQREHYILDTIENASIVLKEKYFHYPEDAIKLYVGKTDREGYDSEIFMDVNLQRYPLRDYEGLWAEMHGIVKSYNKIGKRNEKTIAHDKLGKHMMHLVRLYYMCFDILERAEINTFREKEHDLLMKIRNGEFLDNERQPIPEFYELVNTLQQRLEYAKSNTILPEKVDMNKVNDFIVSINEQVCR